MPGLQDLRAARATRLDRKGPRGRGLRPRRVRAGRRARRRRDVDRRSQPAPQRHRRGGPGGGGGRVPRRASGLRRHGDPRRAAPHRVPAPRRPRRRLSRLHRRQPVRGVATRGPPADRARRRLRQPALRQPDVVGVDRARGAGARRRAAPFQRSAGRVRLHLHAERHRRAATRRRGVSVRAAGPVPGDVRQPQLGQRHPRVRAGEGGAHGVRAARCARPSRRRRGARAPPRRGRPGPAQPLRLSGAVQLLRRQASARVDRAGPRAGLGRAARLRRVRTDEQARPGDVEAGLRRDLLLQDVRLPDGPRRPARARPDARPSPATVVRGRHRGRGDRPERHGRTALRPCGLRGRHRRLPRHPGRRDRPAPSRADRRRHDLPAGRGARDLAARGAAAPAALGRRARRHASTGRRRGTAAGPPSR